MLIKIFAFFKQIQNLSHTFWKNVWPKTEILGTILAYRLKKVVYRIWKIVTLVQIVQMRRGSFGPKRPAKLATVYNQPLILFDWQSDRLLWIYIRHRGRRGRRLWGWAGGVGARALIVCLHSIYLNIVAKAPYYSEFT
jgi:hypothetical protein